ncbi:hypothetical protein AZE42_10875 [Rhizopogon vesiculosus]|uniref:Uncharacterized protein n=1 Tax=Rhizopogon vesiculosus TaxID=180088 RepID=A0A1J8RAY0_9AGAM|nr:hypothetical protein AZE42_10875 [Rhizopogon vesiculosus]
MTNSVAGPSQAAPRQDPEHHESGDSPSSTVMDQVRTPVQPSQADPRQDSEHHGGDESGDSPSSAVMDQVRTPVMVYDILTLLFTITVTTGAIKRNVRVMNAHASIGKWFTPLG